MAKSELKKIQEALKNTTLSGRWATSMRPICQEAKSEGVDFEGTREKIREVKDYH